jgi:hypothetical protein
MEAGTLILINGPLDSGKSTLASQILDKLPGKSICLDGDALIEYHPEPDDALDLLHESLITLASLQHHKYGLNNWIVSHLWQSPYEIADLRRRFLDPKQNYGVRHIFSFCLYADPRVLNERILSRKRLNVPSQQWEMETSLNEAESLTQWKGTSAVGEFLDSSCDISTLVHNLSDNINRTIELAKSRSILCMPDKFRRINFLSLLNFLFAAISVTAKHYEGLTQATLNGLKCTASTEQARKVKATDRVLLVHDDFSVALVTITSVLSLGGSAASAKGSLEMPNASTAPVLLVEFVVIHLFHIKHSSTSAILPDLTAL